MTGALLEAVDVVKQLGSGAGAVQALEGVNLLLTGGQMTMLMGPFRERQDHAALRFGMHV